MVKRICDRCGALMDGGNENETEKLRRALTNINATIKSEDECRRSLIEEYTDVIHCALVLDLEMDLDQIRQKTERWMRRLGIAEDEY